MAFAAADREGILVEGRSPMGPARRADGRYKANTEYLDYPWKPLWAPARECPAIQAQPAPTTKGGSSRRRAPRPVRTPSSAGPRLATAAAVRAISPQRTFLAQRLSGPTRLGSEVEKSVDVLTAVALWH